MASFIVPLELQGERIDRVVQENMNLYSRAHIQRLIRQACVRINGNIAKKGNRVVAGQIIEVLPFVQKESRFEPYPMTLDILFEDEDLLIVNKPAGLLTHPSAYERKKTLVNALLSYCGERLSGIGGEKRPGIVHRLDKDTSGLLIVAKHDESHRDLAKQIQQRKIKKYYLALVAGTFSEKRGTIEAPLKAIQKKKGQKVVISPHPFGKPSITHFAVLQSFHDCSLLKVELQTGRMHQIRVHFSSLHHPIIGDTVYGNTELNIRFSKLGLHRHFLHASKLTFQHPRTKIWMNFESPLPEDLDHLVKILQQKKSTQQSAV